MTIKTESPKLRVRRRKTVNVKPKLYLGEDTNNLYAIISKASQRLKEHGQMKQSQEMRHRVFNAPSFEVAMEIVGEYVEIHT